MDRLLDSFKETNGTVNTIFLIIVLLIVALLIVGITMAYYFFKSGYISFSQIIALFTAGEYIKQEYLIISLSVFIFLIILTMLIRSQYKSPEINLKGNQGIIPYNKTFWQPTSTSSVDIQNLFINSNDWDPISCKTLSYGMELVLFNTRTESNNNPYRHLFHRGSGDLVKPTPGLDAIGSGGISDGLPSEMTPGVFVDRHTNDIIVFVDTDSLPVKGSRSHKYAYRESIRVNDLPLNIPFYLHLVIINRVLEIYVNCRLAGTKILQGTPRNMPNQMYGRTGKYPARGLIQNLTLWDGSINTFDLMKMCKKEIKFKKETWDLAISGKLPSFGLSQCGEVTIDSKPFNKTLSLM